MKRNSYGTVHVRNGRAAAAAWRAQDRRRAALTGLLILGLVAVVAVAAYFAS